jgi:hypothetical protein
MIYLGIDALNEKDNKLYRKGYQSMQFVTERLAQFRKFKKVEPRFNFKVFIIPVNSYTSPFDLQEKWDFISKHVGIENLADQNDMWKELKLLSGTQIAKKQKKDETCEVMPPFHIKPKYSIELENFMKQHKNII